MSMKQIRFYALRSDIAAVLAYLDTRAKLKYLVAGRGQYVPEPASWQEIVTLGRATSDSGICSLSFLVAKEQTQIVPREIGDQFVIDQLWNPDAIMFTPAGAWDAGTILSGRVGTPIQQVTLASS
jgi:hypothetical protein